MLVKSWLYWVLSSLQVLSVSYCFWGFSFFNEKWGSLTCAYGATMNQRDHACEEGRLLPNWCPQRSLRFLWISPLCFSKAVLNWMPCNAHPNTLQLTFKHASWCLQCWCLKPVQLSSVLATVNLESGKTNLPSAMLVHDQASQSPAWSGRSLWNSTPSRRAVDEC